MKRRAFIAGLGGAAGPAIPLGPVLGLDQSQEPRRACYFKAHRRSLNMNEGQPTDNARMIRKLSSNEQEAANRAEATALLIRAGYRVYRPEADVHGEDLVLRKPTNELLPVQLKGRPCVDKPRYGGRGIAMLFPDPRGTLGRPWYLVPHDPFFDWVEARHGRATGWANAWSYPSLSRPLAEFLGPFRIKAADNV